MLAELKDFKIERMRNRIVLAVIGLEHDDLYTVLHTHNAVICYAGDFSRDISVIRQVDEFPQNVLLWSCVEEYGIPILIEEQEPSVMLFYDLPAKNAPPGRIGNSGNIVVNQGWKRGKHRIKVRRNLQ